VAGVVAKTSGMRGTGGGLSPRVCVMKSPGLGARQQLAQVSCCGLAGSGDCGCPFRNNLNDCKLMLFPVELTRNL